MYLKYFSYSIKIVNKQRNTFKANKNQKDEAS